jgi:multiple sugar transport system substrate-binding protein
MKSWTKALAAFLVMGAASLPLPAMAQTELSLVSWFWGAATYGDWLEEVVAKFEAENPGVTIARTKVTGNRFDTNYALMVAGTPSDVTHLASREYQPFAAEGFLEDLGPWIEKSGLDLTGWAGQSTCEWEGKTYCIMMLYSGYVMGYNEKLLEEAGVAVPTDYDSYLEAITKVTKDVDKDGITDVYGAALNNDNGSNLRETLMGLALDAGGNLVTPEGAPAFDSPPAIEALTRYKQIVTSGLTPKGATTEDLRAFLNEGRVGIMIDGPWIEGIMQNAAEDVKPNLRLARDPLDPPVGGTSNIMAIPVDISPEKKELAWKFIETAISREMQMRWAEISSSPAPMPGLDYTALRAANPNFQLIEEAGDRAAAAHVDRILKGFEITSNELNSIIWDEVQKMIINDQSPEDTAAAIQAKAVALQQQG